MRTRRFCTICTFPLAGLGEPGHKDGQVVVTMVLNHEDKRLDSWIDRHQAGLDHIVALHVAEPANDRSHRRITRHPEKQPFFNPAAGGSASTRSHGQAECE